MAARGGPGVRRGSLVLAVALLAGACSGEPRAVVTPSPTATSSSPSPSPTQSSPSPSPSQSPTRSPTPTPTARRTTSTPKPSPTGVPPLRLRRIVTLAQPVAMGARAGDSSLFIVEKEGRVIRFRDGATRVVLDIRSRISSGGERGLLGLAFSDDGSKMFVNYTDTGGDTRIVEYDYANGSASSPRELLRINQPYANHNGGMLAIKNGLLYIATGDGGSGGDPQGNAQSLETLLGKILRIDPRASGGDAYRIPSSNPFVGRAGRDEIWSYGLRNPWRFSFDRANGAIWIGDVGQSSWEEINYRPGSSKGGENYGWDRMEGRHRFEGSPPPGDILPIHEYARSGGNCAVTGGYVYRHTRIRALQGWYLYADYCGGRVMRLRRTSGGGVTVRDTGLRASSIVSFGEGPSGELYVLSLDGGVFRIVPA